MPGEAGLEVRARKVARRLSNTQRDAWRNAEWQGEYFAPPCFSAFDLAAMYRLGLLDGPTDDAAVTSLGEQLIVHLRGWRPALFKLASNFVAALRLNPTRNEESKGG